MKEWLTALVVVGLMAGPAFAFRCPLVAKEVSEATAFRYDDKTSRPDGVAIAANALVAQGMALHAAGKHEEAIDKIEQAVKLSGLTPRK